MTRNIIIYVHEPTMSHLSGHFEGASTFLTPKLSFAREMAHKVIVPTKKIYVPQFLKQRDIKDINSY
jgi:hypothetical protein